MIVSYSRYLYAHAYVLKKKTMKGIAAWYYPGQNESRIMNACESIAEAIANGVGQDE